MNHDENLIYLGSYDVYWKNISNKKVFFKFNSSDKLSINSKISETSCGTATWKCKQLVLRIFETEKSSKTEITDDYKEYILNNELSLGTTYKNGVKINKSDYNILTLLTTDLENNKADLTASNLFRYGSQSITRKYADTATTKCKDAKFKAGFEYKLGGIQLLLSPDIFSVSEMKMYNYGGQENNKVFIGEWNKDDQELEYYGAGTIKTSPFLDISNLNVSAIAWKHNFNIPPRYLDAQVFVRFSIDYNGFYVGDIISNLVNINKEPLTVKLTGTEVQVNISNGIGFTNPETGEFLTFYKGKGIQLDKPGNFDAYKAALKIGANILDYGSTIASEVNGGYPFQIYFVIKRLF